jgi:hypothetical protein
MNQTPINSPYHWRTADLKGIRVAFSIPVRMTEIRAIQRCHGGFRAALPRASGGGEHHQMPRGPLDEAALRDQQGSHAKALLLKLPTLTNWGRDP